MVPKLFAIIFLSLFVTGCMSDQTTELESKTVSLTKKAEPSEAFVPLTVKVVGIGDSLTKGVGDESENGGYVGIIEETLEQQENIKEVIVDNYGVRGHKATNLQKRLKEEEVVASIKDADIILMTIGGNDIMNVVRSNIFSLGFEPFRKEQENFESRLSDIFETIRIHNKTASIIYIGLYNPFKYMLPDLTEFDSVIEEWNMASNQMINNDPNAYFVPVEKIFSTKSDEKLLYEDQFHPNKRGYSLIADNVYKVMGDNEVVPDLNVRKE